MTASRPSVAESYAFCHATARRAGSSFYPCFRLLPRAQRRAMEALYAFTRHTDDLGDNPRPAAERREALEAWRASLDEALAGRFPIAGDCPYFRLGAKGTVPFAPDSPAARLLPAVADAVRAFGIPHESLGAVIDGVAMDLEPRPFATFDDLAAYCHKVASSVGLACVHIWGYEGPEPVELARQCGLAFQLTNILRDLVEDARMGRVYLPREDFQRTGYSVEQLRRREPGEPFARLVALESARAEAFYRSGSDLIDRLAPSGRRVFGMMVGVYYHLLQEIRRRPERLLVERVSVGRWTKLRVATRWMVLPPRRASLPTSVC